MCRVPNSRITKCRVPKSLIPKCRATSIQPVNDVGAPVNARSLSLDDVGFEPRRRRVNESEAINLQGRTLGIAPLLAPPPSPDDAVSEPRRRRVNETEAINLQGRTLVIEPPIAPPPSPAHDFHMDQHSDGVQTPDDTNVNSSPASTVNESTLEQIQGEEENTAAHDKQAKFLHEQISNYPSEYKNEIVEEPQEPPQPYSSDDETSRPSIEINVDGSISTSEEETIEKSPSSVLYSPKHIFKDKKPKTINDNKKGHQNKDKSKRTIRKNVKITKMSKIASAKTEPVIFPNRARIHPKATPSEEDLLKQILEKNTKTRRDNEPNIIRYNSC
uniref:Candidate secreted effector n=1 Tax=Meloidogyne incognita TaxID=6306 RepID=A0A914LN77_MELIC